MKHRSNFNFATLPGHRARRDGYVLLVTLGLLVLSTTLLVAVGRAAARHALDANLQQSDLQRRWGVISCRSAVLDHSEQILVSLEQQEQRAVPIYRTTIGLGDDRFTLIVSDEQAKANINQMIDQFGQQGTEDRLAESLTGTGLLNRLRIRSSVYADDSPSTQPTAFPKLISGPGQLFDSVGPDQLLLPLQNLTCWGTGALNVLRADQISIRSALAPVLTRIQISSLIGARDKIMKLSVESHAGSGTSAAKSADAIGSLLAAAKIDAKVRNRLSLTTTSTCHSLLIIAQDRRRSWYSLAISDDSSPDRPVIHSIVW